MSCVRRFVRRTRSFLKMCIKKRGRLWMERQRKVNKLFIIIFYVISTLAFWKTNISTFTRHIIFHMKYKIQISLKSFVLKGVIITTIELYIVAPIEPFLVYELVFTIWKVNPNWFELLNEALMRCENRINISLTIRSITKQLLGIWARFCSYTEFILRYARDMR